MRKFFSEKNIMLVLIILNIFVAVNSLIDYKTERLIDTNSDISKLYIYDK